MTLWQGRFNESMSDIMKTLNNSLKIDIQLLPYDVKLNEAWAEELATTDILNGDELEKIKATLANIQKEYENGVYDILSEDEDVHSLVERVLTERLGDTGKKIHTGKSRNDQVVTDLMLYLKDAVYAIENDIKQFITELTGLAETHLHTIMPGYTHMQQAQPILLSHYLLSLAFSLEDDLLRLKRYKKGNLSRCPLGSGALAGTTLDVHRSRLAKRLGFEEATPNSLQSVSDRAFVIELASHLAIIAMHLSRYAEDMIIWNSNEFNFITLSDCVSTGSSMMPQKKNPDSLELIRGMTGTLYADLIGLLTLTKGLPLAYAKDLQDDKKFIFDALETTHGTLCLFTEVINNITFNTDQMLNALSEDIFATDIADHCIEKGIPFREAHEIIGEAVKLSQSEGKALKEIVLTKMRKLNLDESSISPSSTLTKRSARGGTAPSSVKEQIDYLKRTIPTY